jgi:hypothetical protein
LSAGSTIKTGFNLSQIDVTNEAGLKASPFNDCAE